MSQARFMNASVFLFRRHSNCSLVVGYIGLLSQSSITISEVGISTSIYSLVLLTATVTGLGLEYPLLKRISVDGSKILSSALLIEIAATIAVVPLMIYILIDFYHHESQSYSLIAVGMLISITLGFVPRYALLGISASKTILVIDTISDYLKVCNGLFTRIIWIRSIGCFVLIHVTSTFSI